MKRSRCFVVPLVLAVGLFISAGQAAASTRNGLSLGIGLGTSTVSNEEQYDDISTDLYPEVQLAYDIGPAKIGLHAGYIYRKYEKSTYSWTGRYYSYSHQEYTLAFVPVELDLCVMPLRFVGHGRMAFQPYLGIGAGTMIAAGDNDEDHDISPVVRAGFEWYLGDWNIIGIDIAHHAAKDHMEYTTVMFEYRFRIPFVKKHQHGGGED